MLPNNKINYVEFASRDIAATRKFFSEAFGWQFADYGPDYIAFSNQGIDGGFYRADKSSSTDSGGALVVLYSDALEASQMRVESAGAVICKAIFDFPGGRRFHFQEPGGNELAIWTDRPAP